MADAPAIVEGLDKQVRDMIARREASRDWLKDNYWDEFKEAYQGYKCRVDPIDDPKTGKEDLTRTNIAMPDPWIITRKKTARLSARPPVLRVRSKSPEIANWLSGFAVYQWDRAGEQPIQKRHTLQNNMMGFSIKRHFWDSIQFPMKFRRSPKKLAETRGAVMDENTGELGIADEGLLDRGEGGARKFEDFNEIDRTKMLAGLGPEISETTMVRKFEGPVSKFIFLGDYYPEPEFESVHTAAWNIFEYFESEVWLKHMVKLKFKNLDTGKEQAVFKQEAIKKLIDLGGFDKKAGKGNEDSDNLKQELRDAIFAQRPTFSADLMPMARFKITEEHTMRDGYPWIAWMGNEEVFLGEMPYPWDLYGKYAMSGLATIPDLLFAIGDASPRILRFLFRLHNVTVAQRTDLVTQHLKPLYFVKKGANIPVEVIDRGTYRVAFVDNPLDYIGEEKRQPIPAEAFQQEQQILSMIQMAEPAMNVAGGENPAIPASERRATLGLIQQRSAETLASDELEALNLALKDETEIKIHMLQQAMREELDIPEEFFSHVLTQSGVNAQTIKRKFGPLDIQEDFEAMPEQGSTLALDDELKKAGAFEIYQFALQNPTIWKLPAAARLVAETYPGHTTEELLVSDEERAQAEEAAASQPPPLKASLQIKFDDLPKSVQGAIIQKYGIPISPGDQKIMEITEGIQKVSEAADSVDNLTSTGEEEETRARE